MFFSFVIDVWSRRVVGWQFASHMRTDLVLDALRMALSRRRHGADVELVHHSDRGSQYLSYDYAQTLADHGVLASCGRVGSAYDNALAESFVDTFKTELIADRVWRTQSQLELAIVAYIGWYNHDRLHEVPKRYRADSNGTTNYLAKPLNGDVPGRARTPDLRLWKPSPIGLGIGFEGYVRLP